MHKLILVLISAICFGIYSMPFSKIAKWNLSLPTVLIGGALFIMLYALIFEKVNYFQVSPYPLKHLVAYLSLTIFIYSIGFVAFGKLLSGPIETVQLYNALCTSLIPVFALVIPAILERKMISLYQAVGMIFVIIGVLCIYKK